MHVICGEAFFDILSSSSKAGALRALPGGSPLNVAVGMARLGARCALATDIARDALGDHLASFIERERIDPRFIRRELEVSPYAFVSRANDGTTQYAFQGLCDARYYPSEKTFEATDDELSGFHMGSLAAILPRSALKIDRFAARFDDRVLVSLDPNVRLSFNPHRTIWRTVFNELRIHTHLIKASEEDVAALYGDEHVENVCVNWLSGKTKLVVLTRGSRGATFFSLKAGRVDIAPVALPIVDTVGAGDSFMAAILAAFAHAGQTPEKWLDIDADSLQTIGTFAACAAALTCSQKGPILPQTATVRALFDKQPSQQQHVQVPCAS